MLNFDAERGRVWAVVLAGGEGERMAPLTLRWLGQARPKQYCTFAGTRSMLQHTFDRIAPVVAPENVVTIVGKGHRLFMYEACKNGIPGTVVEQPLPRGTATGIMTGAALALSQDPDATLLIVPSDHFIFPETRFLRYAAAATAATQERPECLVLLAAVAREPETDYGWLEGGEIVMQIFQRAACGVHRFFEKPNAEDAQRFHRQGWLWNTMILAVRGRTLWSLAREHFPVMMERMEKLRALFRRAGPAGYRNRRFQSKVLGDIYYQLGSEDFSRGLLERRPDSCVALPMGDLEWDDWGRPQRIIESLARIGRKPAFPVHLCKELDSLVYPSPPPALDPKRAHLNWH